MRSLLGAIAALSLSLVSGRSETPPQPVAFRVGPLLFDRPEDWKWVKPEGSFRVAQLEKAGPSRSLVVMAFSRFPGGTGGSVQANVDRWIRQFSQTSAPAEVQELKGKSCPVTMVKIRGSLKGGLPGGPEKEIQDALLLGAIFEAEGELIVVKVAGSATTVASEEKSFSAMVAAAAEKKP